MEKMYHDLVVNQTMEKPQPKIKTKNVPPAPKIPVHVAENIGEKKEKNTQSEISKPIPKSQKSRIFFNLPFCNT